MIEKLFSLAQGLESRIVFSAVGRFERYYAKKDISSYPLEELDLTAIASIFIVFE